MTVTPIMADGLPPGFVELLERDFHILEWNAQPSVTECEQIEALVTYGHPCVDGPLLDRFPRLKVVSNHGVGVDHIDVAAASDRGIPVGNTPGCLDQATADMTMTLLLAVARNIVIGDRHARGPDFTHYDPAILIGKEVSGSTLGIVGLGRIGRQVAKRALSFDMTVLYHNRHRDLDAEKSLGVRYLSFEELLSTSDFISLNCPLTSETTGMISTSELALMKPDAMLINMARGPVVDTAALYEALANKRIAGAGLDVTDPEPLPRNHPLLELSNVVIAPHLGSATDRTRRRMMEMTIENLRAGVSGSDLPYRVIR
ncbi:MAG: D-glycerate dehydrogenase [Planctomycetota bacterium]|nr:D-glycerate dehydrogenase [Planctomycetota bacterium]MDA1212328.1 D-glycerate dehydrogenase [Planctomycetota bacterium]